MMDVFIKATMVPNSVIAGAAAFISVPLLAAPKSTPSRILKLVLHTSIYTTGLAFNSLVGVVSGLAALVGGDRYRQQISWLVARSFYYTVTPLVGWKFNVIGEEKFEPFTNPDDSKRQSSIMVSNHQTALDILFLGRIFPKFTTMMAKQEIKKIPLLGWWMVLSKAVFINRKDRKDAITAFNRIGNEIKDRGISVWIFPEGTRCTTPSPSLLPFKKGAFHLAIQAQIPILPVLCENYYHLANYNGDANTGGSRFERGQVQIKVLDPIPTTGLTSDDVQTLIDYTYEYMLYHLKLLSSTSCSLGKPLPPPPSPFNKPLPTKSTRTDDEDVVLVEKS